MDITFAIIICSDTRTVAEDEAGAALRDLIEGAAWRVVSHAVVRDDAGAIASAIASATDRAQADIVLTCGGTGLSPRDVTPEATAAACDRDVPGIAEAIRAYSLAKTRRAMLSRARCMQRWVRDEAGERTGKLALVINFPGSTKAARECWEAISDQLEHAMKMSAGGGH
ncbi:MAG: MogA/MoaB family molybdenum cofactor biosynthesis protein [Coriobacteriaceae bacterium]|nr:MogA/MoaB family molybdenum cofactor biosynthesis protein [Coriobacteriaceae bacterium]